MNFWSKVKKEMNKKLPESYMFLLEESRQLINTALTLSKEQHEKKIRNCKKYVKVYQYAIGGETLHRGYYCPSLIKDIVIGNCNRGRLVRNTKKAKKITYEYGICDNQLSLNGMEGIKMVDITEIMDMLDWHMPSEIQLEGISLARNIETIIPFIQPLTPKHNKNVWDNCAVIIAEKSDEKIKPHLVELLEWLQDMNWPGAFCILDRLKNYSDNNSILSAISICLQRAKDCNDGIWEDNLLMLQEMLL